MHKGTGSRGWEGEGQSMEKKEKEQANFNYCCCCFLSFDHVCMDGKEGEEESPWEEQTEGGKIFSLIFGLAPSFAGKKRHFLFSPLFPFFYFTGEK